MKATIKFTMFNHSIKLSGAAINSWLIVMVISIFIILVSRKIKKVKAGETPGTLVSIMEFFVEKVEDLVRNTMGDNGVHFAPYIATLLIFLVFANLLGLLGLETPTSNYSVTLALAMITFVMIHFSGIRSAGVKKYLKGFAKPTAVMLPINLISEIATPISMSFRLFGNMLSGTVIIALIFSVLNSISIITVPIIGPFINLYFDVFVGLVQTFIFSMLTMVFISNKMNIN
ncbi:F0F1 ATP synthase subunit A [Clostridium intestinale]|uniref:F0F1 ATP synthase subunit A n=1 Tax=Clostridium intestinale TaxID=36845 RepID=UPI002DD6447C|nr:F0F1 ATP synthase subunit A [Clostridium intestinale]WRY49883.1 F0F1 ATP synthase subunit A [Clostridium intestinale]